jgi:hypothetical protein
MAVMIREQANEAEIANQAERDAYMRFLEQESDLSVEKRRFLAAYMQSGLMSRASLASGTPLRTCYEWLKRDENFRLICEEAKKFAADRLEQVAIDLATGAYMRPLVSQGRIAAYERIYDTKALLALLKARKPQEFAQRVDITSNGHSLVKLIDKDTWDSV